MAKYIIDISHHHPVTDWAKAKEVSHFLISKGTQGTHFVDDTLKSFINGCEKNKIPYWLYCFPERDIEVESVKFFLKTVKPLIGKYFVGYALDVESYTKKVDGKKQTFFVTNEGATKAMKLLQAEGYKTLLYTGQSEYDRFKETINVCIGGNTAWWEARYGKNDGNYPDLNKYPIHDKCDLHQYCSTKVFSCFKGGVDISKVRESATGKTLDWYTTVGKVSEIKTETKKEEVKTSKLDVEKVIATAIAEIGYMEKKSNSQLDSKTANAGSGNFTKYWRDMKPSYQGEPWCDCWYDWIMVQSYGKEDAQKLECGGCGEYYTPSSAQYYKNNGQWHTTNPQRGDQIFFHNETRICHTGIVEKYDKSTGYVHTIEGNTSPSEGTVIANGGMVCRKKYKLDSNGKHSRISGYGRPKYDKVESSNTEVKTTTTSTSKKKTYEEANKGQYLPKSIHKRGYYKKGDSTTETLRIKKFLLWVYPKSGITVKTGLYGDNTVKHVKKFQKEVGIEVDGKWGRQTQAKAKEFKK